MTRIFYDTEFTDLNLNARLISIGLVDATGSRTFYAELADTYTLADCSPFVRQEVLPLLQDGNHRMSLHELAEQLRRWLAGFAKPVELLSDSTWDHLFIWDIFGSPEAWPENLLRPGLIELTPAQEQVFVQTIEAGYARGLRRHHALDDAIANRRGWLAVQSQVAMPEE